MGKRLYKITTPNNEVLYCRSFVNIEKIVKTHLINTAATGAKIELRNTNVKKEGRKNVGQTFVWEDQHNNLFTYVATLMK